MYLGFLFGENRIIVVEMAAAAPAPEDPLRPALKIVRCRMPSSPHGAGGVSNAQGVIEPPSRFDSGTKTRRPPRDTDYICPPSHILLTVKSKKERKLNDQGIPLSAKRQRRGDVPKLMANFFEIAFDEDGTPDDVDVEFFGVSHDGVTDYKAAKKYPDSAGRLTAAVQGAVTIFCDHRHLVDAHPGDVLEYVPVDSGLRWTDGHSQFAPCIVRKYDLDIGLSGISSPHLTKLQHVLDEINDYNFRSLKDPNEQVVSFRKRVVEATRDPNPNAVKETMQQITPILFKQSLITRDHVSFELFQFTRSLMLLMETNPDDLITEDSTQLTKRTTHLMSPLEEEPLPGSIDELVSKAIDRYVIRVFDQVFGKNITFVNVDAFYAPSLDKTSLISIMCYTIVYIVSEYVLRSNPEETVDVFQAVPEDFTPVKGINNYKILAMMMEYGLTVKEIDDVKDNARYANPVSIQFGVLKSTRTIVLTNKVPVLLDTILRDGFSAIPLKSDATKNSSHVKYILSAVNSFSGLDRSENILHFYIPRSQYDNMFSLRLLFVLPGLFFKDYIRTGKKTRTIETSGFFSFTVKGANFDLSTPNSKVYDEEHKALVRKARRMIDEHTKTNGAAPTISIGTSGYFIDTTHEPRFQPKMSTSKRCFATLLEKGIGAHKNQIRVYLNPALRAL